MDADWIELPTGRFRMGSDDSAHAEDERPSRLVTVGSFSVAAALVTNEQFERFVDATSYVTVAEREGTSFVESTLVEGADWRRPFGPRSSCAPSEPVVHVAWMDALDHCAWSGTRLPTEAEWEYAITSRPELAKERKWQWCADWYDPDFFRDEQRVNPQGPPNGMRRVARGGGARATARAGYMPDRSADDIGYRVVRLATREA